MATSQRYPKNYPFFGNDGNLLSLGELSWFHAQTTTPHTVYADAAESVPLPNPLTLNASGRAVDSGGDLVAIYFSDSSGNDVKEVIKDSNGATLSSEDAIPRPVDPTEGLSDFSKPLTQWSTDTASSVDLGTSALGRGRLADTSSNSITYNLPSASAAGNGKGIAIKKTNAANAVKVSADGSETIDGSASDFSITENNGVVWIFSDGANWRVLLNQGIVHPGVVWMWTTATAPTGWLECDGSAVSRTTYAALFAAIGVTYGNGDGSTTFNLPDLRGEFVRGFDNAAGNDPDAGSRTDRGDGTTGDNVGTKQDYEIQSHTHDVLHSQVGRDGNNSNAWEDGSGTDATTATGGNETRPRNVALMFIIRAA